MTGVLDRQPRIPGGVSVSPLSAWDGLCDTGGDANGDLEYCNAKCDGSGSINPNGTHPNGGDVTSSPTSTRRPAKVGSQNLLGRNWFRAIRQRRSYRIRNALCVVFFWGGAVRGCHC